MHLAHHFRFMAAYHKHSTLRLISAVQQNISPHEYQHNFSLYFRSVHGTMAHLLGGDQIWFERISGIPTPELLDTIVPIYNLEPPDAIGLAWEQRSPDQAQLFQDLVDICDDWETLLHDKDDAWCTGSVTYHDTAGLPTTLIRASGLSQVFNHGTHHRGQVSATFSKMGKDCPSFDLQSMEEKFAEYKS